MNKEDLISCLRNYGVSKVTICIAAISWGIGEAAGKEKLIKICEEKLNNCIFDKSRLIYEDLIREFRS